MTVVVSAALAACDDNALEAQVRALGEGCLLDSDCESDLVCVFRRCHIECVETPDCVERGQDTICVLGDKPTNVCLLPDELACEGTFDCPGDTVCARDDVCRDPCTADTDCLAGQQCLKGTCADIDGEGLDDSSPLLDDELGGLEERCRYNSECLSPLTCRGGICEQECLADRDCPNEERCIAVDGAMLPDALACVAPTVTDPNGPAHCADGVLSGDETAPDCGGSCHPCPSGAGCTSGADCASGVCTGDVCQVATCGDGVRNGTETGVDCGGACPDGCAAGTDCSGPGDCMAPATCDLPSGKCVAPTCSDGVLNGMETWPDCGGPECAPCGVGQNCVTPGDCTTLVCQSGTCLNASCTDGLQNQGEADVDCGGNGTGCAPCGNGADCADDVDCASGSCTGNICTAPTCSDGVQNGFELGVDCGGGCPNGCAAGTGCVTDADCESGTGCHPVSSLCTATRTLTVDVLGAGTGVVTSTPSGLIDCGAGCTAEVFEGSTIDLVATPGNNSAFGGFGGDCSGPSCSITVGATDPAVNATFNASMPGLASWQYRPTGIDAVWHTNGDAFGNLLVAGEVRAAPIDLGCFAITPSSADIYISRLAPGPASLDDACIGAVVDGSPTSGNEQAIGIHTDSASGNLVVALLSDDPFLANLGAIPCEEPSGQRLVIAEYPPDLESAAVSARCYGKAFMSTALPSDNFRILAQAYSANDELYLAGSFEGTNLRLDDAVTPAFTATTVGGADGIVVKYDANRDVVASYTFGDTTNEDLIWDVAIDPTTGNVALAAQGRGDIDFGNSLSATDVGNLTQAFVILLDANLTPIWVAEFGSSTYDGGRAVAFLPNGNVAAALVVGGVINFGGTFSNPLPGAGAGDTDIALVELSIADGSLAGASSWRRYQSEGAEAPRSIWAHPSTGMIVWSGYSYGPQGGNDWTYEGTLMNQAAFVATTPTLFAPPTWVNQAGTSVHPNTVARPSPVFVSPVDLSVWITSFGGYDWGLGTSTLETVHRLTP